MNDIPLQSVDLSHDRRSTEVFYEFQWRSIALAIDALAKGITFFLAVLTASVGYIAQAKLPEHVQGVAVIALFAVAVLVGLAFCFIAWGITNGLSDLKCTLSSLNPAIFERCGINKYLTRGALVVRLSVALCALSALVLALAAALVWAQ